jgi:carbonic anhydrase
MCIQCVSQHRSGVASRRAFLASAGAAMTLPLLPSAAMAQTAPPKPQNVVSSEQALELLKKGNERYATGKSTKQDFKPERAALVAGQNPYAGILSCADSRVAPEFAFDTGRGDLFVCRVAGNFLSNETLASFEFAVAVLNVPLLMVLGHDACGAVDATLKSVRDGAELPGHLPLLVTAMSPVAKAVANQPGDMLENAIRTNVAFNVERLKSAVPIVNKAVASGKVAVVGGIYRLATGRVEFVA